VKSDKNQTQARIPRDYRILELDKIRKPYVPTERNFEGIQYAELRKTFDTSYNKIHDELSKAYYDFWRFGESYPVVSDGKRFDKKLTPEESKELFDNLHALLWCRYQASFHDEAVKTKLDKYSIEDGELRLVDTKKKIKELEILVNK